MQEVNGWNVEVVYPLFKHDWEVYSLDLSRIQLIHIFTSYEVSIYVSLYLEYQNYWPSVFYTYQNACIGHSLNFPLI